MRLCSLLPHLHKLSSDLQSLKQMLSDQLVYLQLNSGTIFAKKPPLSNIQILSVRQDLDLILRVILVLSS